MKNMTKKIQTAALTATILSTAVPTFANNTSEIHQISESTSKILTANFDERSIVKIEAGNFHFVPGQPAPIHIHAAPAIGYVAKGNILYQVEGERPTFLRQGDAFYEPAGQRILQFNNASATEEAIFVDFNIQQEGEPFIVFENEPTEHIDRRSLPTVELAGEPVDRVDVFVSEMEPRGRKSITSTKPMLGYVAEGVIKLEVKGKVTKRIPAGGSFSLARPNGNATIRNTSFQIPAKVISFYLR